MCVVFLLDEFVCFVCDVVSVVVWCLFFSCFCLCVSVCVCVCLNVFVCFVFD